MRSASNRSSTHFSWSHRGLASAIAIATALTLLSGCAPKPWKDPLSHQQFDEAMKVVSEMRSKESSRSSCIDTDVTLSFTSTLTDRAVSGYMVLLQPRSLKFVTSNPFGQPLLIVVAEEDNVQLIDTLQQTFSEGDPALFADAYDIPEVAIQGEWGKWLTARLPENAEFVALRNDRENRGFWLEAVEKPSADETSYREQLLINPLEYRVAARHILYPDGSTAAKITYGELTEETEGGTAVQPSTITIDGLDYGGSLSLEFSRLREMETCRASHFRLKPPPGYMFQALR